MFGADKRYLSISIQDTTVKIAQAKASGLVEKVARASAADATPDSLSKILKSLLSGFDRKAGVVCVIPASAATSKNIEVPSSDPNEIRSIINLQASRHTPYSREEVLIGHINLGTVGANTKILLVIAHRNVVKERLEAIEKAGLNPDKVLFAPEGIGRLYARGLNLKNNAAPVGVIDFTVAAVNFLVVARGCVVFARSIPMGVKHVVDDAQASVKLCEELVKSMAAYQSEDVDAAPASYVVTTDHDAVKSMVPALNEALKAEVRLSSYVSLVKAGAVRSKLQRDYADDSFLDVIAPVACVNKAEVDLMPEEIILKRTVERQSHEATKAGVAALLIMLLFGAMIMSKIYFKQTFLDKNLLEHFSAQKEEVAKLQDRMAKTRVIREYLGSRMVSLETIHELYRITPTDIYLTSLDMDEEGNIAVQGVSESMSQVFAYTKALDDSPMFKNVKTKSTTTKKERGKDMAVFELALKLEDARKE